MASILTAGTDGGASLFSHFTQKSFQSQRSKRLSYAPARRFHVIRCFLPFPFAALFRWARLKLGVPFTPTGRR